MRSSWFWGFAVWALMAGCAGGPAETAALTELDLYGAIARCDVRYVLLTKDEKAAEARTAAGDLIRISNVGDVDALAAVLSKERVEYFLQEKRSVQMPE